MHTCWVLQCNRCENFHTLAVTLPGGVLRWSSNDRLMLEVLGTSRNGADYESCDVARWPRVLFARDHASLPPCFTVAFAAWCSAWPSFSDEGSDDATDSRLASAISKTSVRFAVHSGTTWFSWLTGQHVEELAPLFGCQRVYPGYTTVRSGVHEDFDASLYISCSN